MCWFVEWEILTQATQAAFELRPGLRTDEGYVADCWLKCLRDSSAGFHAIELGRWKRAMLPLVNGVLRRAEVRIAGPAGDPLTIYGFSVLEPGLVHMVYVRQGWRRMGIAKHLVTGVDLSQANYSTHTMDLQAWIKRRYRLGEYRPFWLDEAANGKADS